MKTTKARRQKKRFLRAVKSKMLDVNIEIAIFLTGGLFENVLLVGEKYEVKVSIVPVWSETF